MQEAAEATTALSTVRRGRKRKSAALEAEADPPDVGAGLLVLKGKVARVSYVQAAEAVETPWTALVAKMY
jgi:hypothetical protein